MELFILIIALLILAETTVLTVQNIKKTPIMGSNQKRKVYVDTSALMDPRLLAVAQTGFISDDLIIPRSVIQELQLLADGKDHDKRLRARAGLDSVRELERVVHFNVTIFPDQLDRTPVDNRLLDLARQNRGAILTNDFNLEKVAATEHIDTLNLNALALVLRGEYLPGEKAKVKIVTVGSGVDQGVAYLRDGTMVVVDHASKKVGEEIEVEFIRVNQTAAGTMMFARPVANKATNKTANKVTNKPANKSTTRTTSKTIAKTITKTTNARPTSVKSSANKSRK